MSYELIWASSCYKLQVYKKWYCKIILVNLIWKVNVLKKQNVDIRESLFRKTLPYWHFAKVYSRKIFNAITIRESLSIQKLNISWIFGLDEYYQGVESWVTYSDKLRLIFQRFGTCCTIIMNNLSCLWNPLQFTKLQCNVFNKNVRGGSTA